MANAGTVAVTGASGFVGGAVVRELVERGYGVRALARDRAKARASLPGVQPGGAVSLVVGDVLDAAVLDDLLRGCTACVHLVGIIRETPGRTFRRTHVDATRAVVHACENAGVRRYLHMSALGVGDNGATEYLRTKWEGERIVRDSRLDWTIFRPGMIHGAGSAFMREAKGWTTGHAAPWFFMPYFTRSVEDKRVPLGGSTTIDPVVEPVYVQDVARAFALALENPAAVGEVYNLVGPERLAWPELLVKIRDGVHGNSHLHPWGIPSKVGAAVAHAARAAGMAQALPFDEGMAIMGGMDAVAEREKVRVHLGLEPAGFSETFRAYAGSL